MATVCFSVPLESETLSVPERAEKSQVNANDLMVIEDNFEDPYG